VRDQTPIDLRAGTTAGKGRIRRADPGGIACQHQLFVDGCLAHDDAVRT
jgi:hypothetical protein